MTAYTILCCGNLHVVFAQTDQNNVVDRIVAIVNDDIVTLYELNQALKPYRQNIQNLNYSPSKEKETLYRVRAELLQSLIDQKLTDQEIERNNIQISEAEIDKTIERIKEARRYTDEDFRAGLSQQGLTMEEYRQALKEQILRTKLVNKEVKSKVIITDADIAAYYERHREKYGGETKYHLWNIFKRVPASASSAEKLADRRDLEAVMELLDQGRSFETLASGNPAPVVGIEGGDLGLFRLNELSSSLRGIVSEMEVGQHSPIIETDFGYQIIYLQNVAEAPALPLSEAKAEIQQILYDDYVENKFQVWLKELRQQSHIKVIN